MNTPLHEQRVSGSDVVLRQRLLRNLAALLVGSALVTVVVAAVRSGSERAAHVRSNGLPVQIVIAHSQDAYDVTRDFTGEVMARRTSDIGFELGGRVVEILVEEGDDVHIGQDLARLDTSRLAVERLRLQAQRSQADAILRERIAGPRAETIAAARAVVVERTSDVELARRKVRKVNTLFGEGRASEEELDDTRSMEQAATARLEQARHHLDELLAGTRSEHIDAQRAVVAQLDAGIAAIDVDLGNSILTAPFAGRIGHRAVDEGMVVPVGRPVVRVVERSGLEARFGVTLAERDTLTVGSDVVIRSPAGEIKGIIWRHLPEIDPATRTMTLIVRFDDNGAALLQPGQIVRLPVINRIAESGMWLPNTALVRAERGLWSCYVLETNKLTDHTRARRVVVEVLHAGTERSYVRGLVSDGDRVISVGVHRIVPGQLVDARLPATEG